MSVWTCRECGKEIKKVYSYMYTKKHSLTKDFKEIEDKYLGIDPHDSFYECSCSIIGKNVDLEDIADFK